MSKLRTLIVGRTFRCKDCGKVFKPDPNDLKCPKCNRRFGEENIIKLLEKSRETEVEISR